MKSFLLKNKYLIILSVILSLNLFSNIIFFRLNFFPYSDFVANFLTYSDTFKKLIYLPTDNYLHQFPFYYLVLKLFGYVPKTISIINLVEASFCFFSFVLFYLKFQKKKIKLKSIILLFIPLFYLINLYNLFSILEHPFNRAVGIGLISLFFFYLIGPKRRLVFDLIFLFAFALLFLGDPIFIYTFAMPLTIAYLIVFLRQKNKTASSLLAVVFIISSIILSLIGRALLNKSGYFLIYGSGANFSTLDGLPHNFKIFIEAFLKLFNAFFFGEDIFAKKTILHLANFLLVSFGIYGLYLFFKKELAKNNPIGLFIPISFLLTILSYIFSNKAENIHTMRFLSILPFLLVFGLFTFIAKLRELKGYYLKIFLLFISAIIILNFLDLRFKEPKPFPKDNYYTNLKLLEVLAKNNVNYGYAEYWKASSSTYLSENKIKIRQILCIEGEIRPFLWIISKGFYEPENYSGKTFLLLDKTLSSCSYQEAIDQFGQPLENINLKINDEEMELLIFNYNIASQF